jgi:hypothetical protein
MNAYGLMLDAVDRGDVTPPATTFARDARWRRT